MRVRTSRYSPGGPSAPYGQTVRSYKFQTTRDENRLWTFFKLTGGPSAPQGRTVPRSSSNSTRDPKRLWSFCQVTGGPSPPHGRTVPRRLFAIQAISATRENTSLDKFYLSRWTVRPSGPDRPPFNPFLTRDENMSLDIFTRVWRTVRPSRPDRPPLNS